MAHLLFFTLDFYTNITMMVTFNNMALDSSGELVKGIATGIPASICNETTFEDNNIYFFSQWTKYQLFYSFSSIRKYSLSTSFGHIGTGHT